MVTVAFMLWNYLGGFEITLEQVLPLTASLSFAFQLVLELVGGHSVLPREMPGLHHALEMPPVLVETSWLQRDGCGVLFLLLFLTLMLHVTVTR